MTLRRVVDPITHGERALGSLLTQPELQVFLVAQSIAVLLQLVSLTRLSQCFDPPRTRAGDFQARKAWLTLTMQRFGLRSQGRRLWVCQTTADNFPSHAIIEAIVTLSKKKNAKCLRV